MRRRFVHFSTPLFAVLIIAAACGGDDGGISSTTDSTADAGGTTTGGADETGDIGAAGSGEGVTGTDAVSLTTDPGTAYAEVDGERLVYESAGSINYTCEVGADLLRVSFQTPEGQDLSIQAGLDEGRWRGQSTFAASGPENVTYTIVFAQHAGTLGVADGALSYEGTADRIEDFDVSNAEEVDLTLAVNCAAAGDGSDPVAVIDGETYTFAVSGAQSFDCAVSDGDVDITVNRLAMEDLQLSIDMRDGPDNWIGSVFIITPEGNFTATLSGAAEGLTIEGNTVTYDGPIASDGGDELDVSVSVTCP